MGKSPLSLFNEDKIFFLLEGMHIIWNKTFILMFLFCGLGICSCHKGKNSVSLHKKESHNQLNLGIIPTLNCLPFLVAKAQGVYDSLGLNLNIHLYTSLSDCEETLKKGKNDAIYCDFFRSIIMQQEKPIYCSLYNFQEELLLLSGRDIRIKNLKQIKKRTVSVYRNSGSDYLCDYIADLNQFNKDDIFRPQISDLFIRKKMLENGQIEATILPQPLALETTLEGHSVLFSTKKLKEGAMTTSVILATTDNYRKKKHLFNKLKIGSDYAIKLINKNPLLADSILQVDYHLSQIAIDSIHQWKIKKPKHINGIDSNIAKTWLKTKNLWSTDKHGFPFEIL